MATEFTKLVFKEKKNLFAQWPPEDTKPKYMIFFSSEPRKQTWPIIFISTDIHSDTRHVGVVCKIVHVAQPEVGINISLSDEGDIIEYSVFY